MPDPVTPDVKKPAKPPVEEEIGEALTTENPEEEKINEGN